MCPGRLLYYYLMALLEDWNMKRYECLGVLENVGDIFEENTEYPMKPLMWMVVLDVMEISARIEMTETYHYLLFVMTCVPVPIGLSISII